MLYKNDFVKIMFQFQDVVYRDFTSRLIPNLDMEKIIGVRVPEIRRLAKQFMKERRGDCNDFMDSLPHIYLEENNLHGIMIAEIKEYEEAMRRTECFLPFVDNWGTCDIFSPKVFKNNSEDVLRRVLKWTESDMPYIVRYGVGVLLSNYLDHEFREEMLDIVASIKSEEYYVKMMVAWYFSTALVKQFEVTWPYIENKKLEPWTHNKAIQKAIESRRISHGQKELLRQLKVKVSRS